MKADRSDCLGCIFRVPLILSSICGMFCIFPQCPHHKSYSVAFKTTWWIRLFSLFLISPLIAYTFTTALGIATAEEMDAKVFITVCNSLMVCLAVLLGVGNVLRIQEKIDELNGLHAIINHRRFYGVPTFITHAEVKQIAAVIRGNLLVSVVAFCWITYQTYSDEDHHRFDSALTRTYATMFSMYLVLMGSTHFLLSNYLYEVLFGRCFAALRKTLTRKGSKFGVPLLVKLQRLQRLYQALSWNYRKLNDIYNPSFVVTVACVVCVAIFSLALDLLLRREGKTDARIFVIYVSSTFGILVYMLSCERINNMNEDILRFLFKHPLSKLNQVEVAQVKVFLRVLTIQKPHLTASHIFTLGTRLLTAITSTIVGYVLIIYTEFKKREK